VPVEDDSVSQTVPVDPLPPTQDDSLAETEAFDDADPSDEAIDADEAESNFRDESTAATADSDDPCREEASRPPADVEEQVFIETPESSAEVTDLEGVPESAQYETIIGDVAHLEAIKALGVSQAVVERVAWAVVPALAEAILKEEIAKLIEEKTER
jgi:hypothetical protein